MRAASLFPPLAMLEQISEKSRPDRLISGCSGVLFGPVLAGEPTKPVLAREQIKKSASSVGTRSRRTAASHQLRDSTSDLRCCQPRGRLFPQSFVGARYIVPARRWIAQPFCGGTIQPVLPALNAAEGSVAEWIVPSCV